MNKAFRNAGLAAAAFLLFAVAPALAQRVGGDTPTGDLSAEPIPIKTEVPIPTGGFLPYDQGGTDGKAFDVAQYIGNVYNFSIAIAGLLAATVMMIGGFQYLTAGGDGGRVNAAKKRIFNALIGLVLALSAYLILYTINPALLQFRLPAGLTSVKTEIAFLPFCDDLAKTYKVPESQITFAGRGTLADCGDAGYLLTKIKNQDGTEVDSHVWCVYRGSKELGQKMRDNGEKYVNDYGCLDDNSIQGARVVGSDLSIHTLAVCMKRSGITQAQLDQEFEKVGRINTSLGECRACNTWSDGAMQNYGYPVGDAGCQMWQNTANNGDPLNYNFSITQKTFFWDTRRVGHDDRSKRMYYCGYSPNNHQCIYVPILCHNVGECDDYDDMVMNWCEAEASDATITCHADGTQKLGSSWARSTGNAAHLIPVCAADPCAAGGGCHVGGLASTRNLAGVGRYTGGYVRVGVRVLSGGLLGSISCDAK